MLKHQNSISSKLLLLHACENNKTDACVAVFMSRRGPSRSGMFAVSIGSHLLETHHNLNIIYNRIFLYL